MSIGYFFKNLGSYDVFLIILLVISFIATVINIAGMRHAYDCMDPKNSISWHFRFFLSSIIFVLCFYSIFLSYIYRGNKYEEDRYKSIEEYYIDSDVLDEHGVSEYEFLDRFYSETGRKIIDDAIDNDEIIIDDSRVYIGQQELLEALGLD